jgi:hypothetical protein
VTGYQDIGNAIAQALLDQIETSLATVNAEPPSFLGQLAGASTPVQDACDGMIWARVAAQFPTDGAGAQLITTRFDSSIPAWVVSVELGHLWCHSVIEESGEGISATEEQGYAIRDGQYRLAIIHAASTFREDVTGNLKQAVMGQLLTPWSPIGPDGGYSGGILVVNTIVGALALCTDD